MKDGQYISLCHDFAADCEYVKGHVSAKEFLQAVLRATGRPYTDMGTIRHIYGRWNVCSPDDDYKMRFMECYTPGRGRFPVTVADIRR
jgi:hypothetical protein